MIVSHLHRFVFFKPIKVAGTSIEAALWKSCDKNTDTYTGSNIISEISHNEWDLSSSNNWHNKRCLDRQDAEKYFIKHNKKHLIKKLRDSLQISHVNVVDPIFFEHSSPVMASDHSSLFKGYTSVSVIRNPFDMLVSYYWWSFNVEETVFESFNERYKKNKKLVSSLRPRRSDNINILKDKMEHFYSLPASFNNSYRKADETMTVLEWISCWQNEFFLEDIDIWIKFEDLVESFKTACLTLGIDNYQIPKFKTSHKKIKIPFDNYFTNTLKDSTRFHFKETFEKFSYQ